MDEKNVKGLHKLEHDEHEYSPKGYGKEVEVDSKMPSSKKNWRGHMEWGIVENDDDEVQNLNI